MTLTSKNHIQTFFNDIIKVIKNCMYQRHLWEIRDCRILHRTCPWWQYQVSATELNKLFSAAEIGKMSYRFYIMSYRFYMMPYRFYIMLLENLWNLETFSRKWKFNGQKCPKSSRLYTYGLNPSIIPIL